MLKWIVAAAIVVGGGYLLVLAIPDIVRYRRISSM
jgi:hypothetical protein